ncbi:MAG: AmmeMemoRadiSam system protein A [Lentisphaeria bacterium]|nr:AmmeMemoRadiSam system protein A [Lentisphaeria bacterium]
MAKEFSPQERRQILAFVREAIESELHGAETPQHPPIPELGERRACFVTLHDCAGNLRGCIGNLEAFEPLRENLVRNALNAAFSDPRFPPLDPEELAETLIEVSILTPPEPIADPTQFLIGVDGIILRQGARGAVFLPQVALEQGWNQTTTLEYLSRKAGLPADSWRQPGALFQTFRAEVFGE